MNTSINIRNKTVDINMEEHIIHITNNNSLVSLLADDTEVITDELVLAIKKTYHDIFNTELDVSDKSIAVEIWGHIYAEKFADAVESLTSINFIDKLAEKIIHHCKIIDIGEPGYDNNRFVWNGLAPFKSAIANLLPKKAM
ncbi:MAG: hypothetical protein ABJB05_02915 [Parafilimonas sp.]